MTLRKIIRDPSDQINHIFQKEFLVHISRNTYIANQLSSLQAQVITRGFRNILEQIVAERRASPTAQDDILAEHLGNGRTKFHLNDELDT